MQHRGLEKLSKTSGLNFGLKTRSCRGNEGWPQDGGVRLKGWRLKEKLGTRPYRVKKGEGDVGTEGIRGSGGKGGYLGLGRVG